MASVNTRELAGALASKFGFENAGGKGHDRYRLMVDGRMVAYVDVSRSQVDLGAQLVSSMGKQAGVNGPTLRGMVACTVSASEYRARIRAG